MNSLQADDLKPLPSPCLLWHRRVLERGDVGCVQQLDCLSPGRAGGRWLPDSVAEDVRGGTGGPVLRRPRLRRDRAGRRSRAAGLHPPERVPAESQVTKSPPICGWVPCDAALLFCDQERQNWNLSATTCQANLNSLGNIIEETSPLGRKRAFGVKDEIFCLFEGALDNLGSLRQQYGLTKMANETILVIEAYKALRDRAPYPPNHVVAHLSGNFAFVVFDKSTSTLFVASDRYGKVPLYWGITADGYVAFADDAELLKGACGKSLAPFPLGCLYSTSVGGLRCYRNPKNKIIAVPAKEEEIWGATFKVEGPAVVAATE